jgi:hypothetical protein
MFVNAVADQVFSFSGVKLGEVAIACPNADPCSRESEIIAPLDKRHSGATITVAVTETGSGFGKTDSALAEIKALQAAFGPAIGRSIETGLGSLDD